MAGPSTFDVIKMLIEARLKQAVKDKIPLGNLAGSLIGYGVACARGAGMSNDTIRETLEAALSDDATKDS